MVIAVTYLPDIEFHATVDRHVDAAVELKPDKDRETLDVEATEALLVKNVWPKSWEALMPDANKEELLHRMLHERRAR